MAVGRKPRTDRARPPRGGPRSDIRPRDSGRVGARVCDDALTQSRRILGNNFSQGTELGAYTGHILQGAKLADLPVLQPTKCEAGARPPISMTQIPVCSAPASGHAGDLLWHGSECHKRASALWGRMRDIVAYARPDRARFEELLKDYKHAVFLPVRSNNDGLPGVLPCGALPSANLPVASRCLPHDFAYVGHNRRQDRRVIETFRAS